MKVCVNCQAQCNDNDMYCQNCGGNQFYPVQNEVQQPYVENYGGETEVLQGGYYNGNVQQYAENQVVADKQYDANQYGTDPYTMQQYGNQQQQVNYQETYFASRPALQLDTNRGLLKYILLSLITFGIYGVYTLCHISGEINIIASRYDGRRTTHYMSMAWLGSITFGIYIFVWFHGLCNRIGNELNRRQIDYKFGAGDFWLWNVIGSLFLIGPFIFFYKFFKATNMLNESYNING